MTIARHVVFCNRIVFGGCQVAVGIILFLIVTNQCNCILGTVFSVQFVSGTFTMKCVGK